MRLAYGKRHPAIAPGPMSANRLDLALLPSIVLTLYQVICLESNREARRGQHGGATACGGLPAGTGQRFGGGPASPDRHQAPARATGPAPAPARPGRGGGLLGKPDLED